MKLRSRDFGDFDQFQCRKSVPKFLNEAPKPRLRRYATASKPPHARPLLNEAPKPRLRRSAQPVQCHHVRLSSMKLRSRDFGDLGFGEGLAGVGILSSMKLRSRDFGDIVEHGSHGVCESFLNEAPKPRLRRLLVRNVPPLMT